MFGIGFSELIILSIIAIVFVGPERLPDMMKKVGKFFVHTRRMATDVRSAMDTVIKDAEKEIRMEEIEQLKKSLKNVTSEVTAELKEMEAEANRETSVQTKRETNRNEETHSETHTSSHDKDLDQPASQTAEHQGAHDHGPESHGTSADELPHTYEAPQDHLDSPEHPEGQKGPNFNADIEIPDQSESSTEKK